MEDLVGARVPRQSEVDELERLIVSVQTRLARFTVQLSTEERARATKVRRGGAEVARDILSIAETANLSLATPTPSQVLADLTLVERLEKLGRAARTLADTIADTRTRPEPRRGSAP